MTRERHIEGVEGAPALAPCGTHPGAPSAVREGQGATRGARGRGASRPRGGCRDAELSPACACRGSSAAHGPGSRLYCRTGGTIARWLPGVGGRLGRALRRSSHRTASGGARAARAGLRGGGGRTCRTASGGTCRPHACRPPGESTCRSCRPQGGAVGSS